MIDAVLEGYEFDVECDIGSPSVFPEHQPRPVPDVGHPGWVHAAAGGFSLLPTINAMYAVDDRLLVSVSVGNAAIENDWDAAEIEGWLLPIAELAVAQASSVALPPLTG